MPRGQFVTVFTLGFATAIALLGVIAGVTLLFWQEPTWWVAGALGAYGNHLSPLYFSLIVAGAGLFVAYWIVRIQQGIVGWAADRTIAKLSREYNEVAQRHGRDQADEFIKQRAFALFERERLDLFGGAS
ncbi:hypothetical protein AOQ73_36340 [Bradyrhizobium pachyrhizi]|uniref:hypothetical protein n=1 Tax=Bradyrhizobium pachyrhizi TaxID=280333 RepID=UPI00070555C9|nr:hypothetical protein [Bradyrhizobium pachyrhizi]KRP85951.1 hypothetical protein AOQ73_36340 [Bradyrhizobium pachyrhizi]